MLDNGEKRQISKEAARWIGANKVAKMFEQGLFTGTVVDHIPDLDTDLDDDSERRVVEYDKTGKKEAVDSEEILAILAGVGEDEDANENEQEEETKEEDLDNLQEEKVPDSPKSKKKQKQKPKKKKDPLIGRKVRSRMQVGDNEEDEAQVTGTIIGVSSKKSGKKKGRYYKISYNDSDLDVDVPNEKVHQGEIKDMLVPS